MKSETWIFVACTIFLVLVTPAYALVTSASEHGLDWTGTSALTMTTLLTGMVSLYLGFHAKRMDRVRRTARTLRSPTAPASSAFFSRRTPGGRCGAPQASRSSPTAARWAPTG